MLLPRRVSFQLTPLLDLLLIVIFAQFLEVRESDAQRDAEFAQQVAVARDRLELQYDELTRKTQQLEARSNAITDQLQTTGQILGEFFQLPETLIDQVLRQQAQTRPPPSPEEQEQLRQKLRGFSELRGRELIRHLLTYDELRKRSDIWEIHLSPGGLVEFRSNGIVRRFRAETIEEFAFGLFATYKSLPEPKGLVILLMSYGDILVGQRRAAMAGLPIVTDRMRRDSAGRTRFEYAVLGFEPDRPPLE